MPLLIPCVKLFQQVLTIHIELVQLFADVLMPKPPPQEDAEAGKYDGALLKFCHIQKEDRDNDDVRRGNKNTQRLVDEDAELAHPFQVDQCVYEDGFEKSKH